MAVAITSGVTLAGPSIRREQLPAVYCFLKIPIASLPVVNLSSWVKCAWLEFNCGCNSLRDVERRRGVRYFMSRSAINRVFTTSATEDKVSQGEFPHFDKRGDMESLKVSQDEGISNDGEATANISESSSESEDMEDIKMRRVCDKLIDVFLVERTKPDDWRVLIAFSQEWPTIRPYFFRRCDAQAKSAVDPKKRADLLKLARQMKEVDNDMRRHDKTLVMVKESPLGLDATVARHREDFTGDFFQHLHLLIEAASRNDLDKKEELVAMASKCLKAVEVHGRALEDDQCLDAAQMKYEDILNAPSLDAAASKIDYLAKTNQLDSTLMLLMTKAWASAKESTLMKDEAKDIMYYLYSLARANMAKSVPKEIQIIRRLLSIEVPRERLEVMTNAFTPGDESDGIYTEPEKLLEWINAVLDAFYSNKKGTLIKEAQGLLNPDVISRLEILRDLLVKQFM